MPSIAFHVPGIPQPKGSRQALPIGGKAGSRRIVLVEAGSARTRPLKALWYANVAKHAEAARKGPLLATPVIVSATFSFPIPKSRLRGKRALKPGEPHVSVPDCDKLCRGVGDSLTGSLIVDDALIFSWHARKVYCAAGEEGVEVLLTW